MVKIESLKSYIRILSKEEFMELSNRIFQINSDSNDYPKYKEWYFKKQLPGIITNERNILFVRAPENSNEIIAVACLKKNSEERKICTLYVCEKYRNQGIATKLIEECKKWAIEVGAKVFELNVLSENEKAINLYRKIGFGEVEKKMRLEL